MKIFTVLWWYVRADVEEKGETTLIAYNEDDAEERFYRTHKKLTPTSSKGYDVYRILEGEEV